MKALIIGGTGTLSSAVAREALAQGWDVTLVNRGNRPGRAPEGARRLTADVGDEAALAAVLADERFDVVADFIAFAPEQARRDLGLFRGRTGQFIFVSSASAYRKPLPTSRIVESTALANPFWAYSRDKIACEELLLDAWRREGFPVTVVRPSHTYDERNLPLAVHGRKGAWQVVDRIRKDKPVLVHGDGTSLWTLTHADDFARGFAGLMGNPRAVGEAFHITSDESIGWNQVYAALGTALGREVGIFHVASDFLAAADPEFAGTLLGDKANSVIFDNAKLKSLVPGFAARVRFDQGVRGCVETILGDTSLQVPDPEFDLFCDRVVEAQRKALESLQGLSI
jgi:nucleoside-diphosphate-sugar epimerase